MPSVRSVNGMNPVNSKMSIVIIHHAQDITRTDVLRERKRGREPISCYRLTGDDDADWHTSDQGRAFIEDVSPERLLDPPLRRQEEEVAVKI